MVIISVIPGINLIAPIAWGWFGMRMLTLEYVDYPLSNHDQLFPAAVHLTKRNPVSTGLGGGLMLITVIPVINFFAMPIGVASATCYWFDHLRDQA